MRAIFACLLALAFVQAGQGQDCATMYDYFKTGTTLEYTNYNKKDKVESVITQKIREVTKHADTLVAIVDATGADEKGTTLYAHAFPIKCHNGAIYMDMQSLIPPQSGNAGAQEMTLEVRSTDMIYPADMKPGQRLPDSEMEMKMTMSGLTLMNTKYTVRNREVERRESVTTPAGTFDCLKITYDMEYKLMGQRTIHCAYWYAPAVGMVKSANYDKKGNVDSRMELTKLEK